MPEPDNAMYLGSSIDLHCIRKYTRSLRTIQDDTTLAVRSDNNQRRVGRRKPREAQRGLRCTRSNKALSPLRLESSMALEPSAAVAFELTAEAVMNSSTAIRSLRRIAS